MFRDTTRVDPQVLRRFVDAGRSNLMTTTLSIGDFSRMTYLSVKALRYYHDVGLLPPASVDPATGYRRYHADQVPAAQVIRRLRDLRMPLDEIRAVLRAPDVAARNAAILGHLQRMEAMDDFDPWWSES